VLKFNLSLHIEIGFWIIFPKFVVVKWKQRGFLSRKGEGNKLTPELLFHLLRSSPNCGAKVSCGTLTSAIG